MGTLGHHKTHTGRLCKLAVWAAFGSVALLLGPGIVAPALGADDALVPYGASTDSVPFARLYAFSASCAVLPCRITLTEHATARGRTLPSLGILDEPPAVMTEQPPSPGPEPCTPEEAAEPFSPCEEALEAWEKRKSHDVYAVWFTPRELSHARLVAALKRYGSVALHVTGVLTDANGQRAVATRTINLKLAETPAARHRQEVRENEEQKKKENSPKYKIEHAEGEYCEKVIGGIAGTPITVAGHIYLHCEGKGHGIIVGEGAVS